MGVRAGRIWGTTLGVCAALLLIVWLARREHEASDRVAHGRSVVGDLPLAPSAVRAPLPLAPEREAIELARDAEELRDPDRALLVEAVLSDGSPAAGAELRWLDAHRRFGPAPEFPASSGDSDEAFADALVRTADARGRARFPRPEGNVRLAGWLGENYGELALLPSEEGPVRLTLAPDPPIRVRVVTPAGTPLADVPVVLRTRNEVLARRLTDSEGRAALPLRARRAALRDPGALVQLGVLLREPIFAPVVPEASEPIVLVAPALGRVEVEIRYSGRLYAAPAGVQLTLAQHLEAELPRDARFAYPVAANTTEGRVVFEPVGLGLDLLALVETREHSESGLEFVGPASPGETREAVVSLRERAPVIRARVVGADGSSLAGALLRLTLADGHLSSRFEVVDVDATGSFRWRLGGTEWAEQARSLTLELIAPRGSEQQGRIELTGLARGDNDLGTILLAPTPLLVAGRVVDAAGKPVGGVLLDVLREFDPRRPNSGTRMNEFFQTDVRGRFELHKSVAEPTIGLKISAGAFRWGPEVVPVGTRALELVVLETGSLSVLVRYEGQWYPNLRLVPGGALADVPFASISSITENHCTFTGLTPGLYALEWGHPWADARGRIDGLVVRAGEETRDPRLEPLDLRGRWPVLHLGVHDETGAPVEGCVLALRRGEEFQVYASRIPGGEVVVGAGPWPLAARLQAPGFRTLELSDLAGDREVVLRRGPLLRLEVPSTLPALPRGWQWVAWIGHGRRDPVALNTGRVETWLEEAGPQSLRLGAARCVAGEWREATWGGEEHAFQVEGDGPTTFLVPPFEGEFLEEVLAEVAYCDPYAAR